MVPDLLKADSGECESLMINVILYSFQTIPSWHYSKDDFGSNMFRYWELQALQCLWTLFTSLVMGKRYKEEYILVYLSKHIDPQYFSHTKMTSIQGIHLQKSGEKYVQTRYQQWLQKYNVYYKDVVIKGVWRNFRYPEELLGASGITWCQR